MKELLHYLKTGFPQALEDRGITPLLIALLLAYGIYDIFRNLNFALRT